MMYMFIRINARVLERTEDEVLQGIEPKLDFVWAAKYIRYDTIESFQSLEKNKTILNMYEGDPIIIRENVDKFYERLKELQAKDAKDGLTDTAEEITLQMEGEEEDEDMP